MDHVRATAIDIGSACYESDPCQHKCTLTLSDGATVSTMIDAYEIVQMYWDLLSYKDQDHFLPLALLFGQTRRQQPQHDADAVRQYENAESKFICLLREKHIARINQTFTDALDFVNRNDIVALFTASLERGYGGCELFVSPFLGSISETQRKTLTDAVGTKLHDCGLTLDGRDPLITISELSLNAGKLTLLPGKYVKDILPKGAHLLVHEMLNGSDC